MRPLLQEHNQIEGHIADSGVIIRKLMLVRCASLAELRRRVSLAELRLLSFLTDLCRSYPNCFGHTFHPDHFNLTPPAGVRRLAHGGLDPLSFHLDYFDFDGMVHYPR